MRTLLIDNYDSFTYNLYQLIGEVCDRPPTVVRNDIQWSELLLDEYDAVVISPGPGRPDRVRDFGISARAIVECGLPTLGVCLGHQGIAHIFGGSVRHAPEPMHGRASKVRHTGVDLFKGLPSPMSVIRYHSLIVDDSPPDLEEIAWTDEGLVMALRHRTAPIWGVQFHPESIGTEWGRELIGNFRDLAMASAGTRRRRIEPPARPPHTVRSRVLSGCPDAASIYQECFAQTPTSFWLDSSAAVTGVSRYSMLGSGDGPLAEFVSYRVSEQQVRVLSAGREEIVPGSIFDYLERELAARHVEKSADLPFDFNLGYVGFLGYELKGDLSGAKVHKSVTPDAAMLFVDRAIVIDHEERNCYLLALAAIGDDAADRWTEAISQQIESLAESETASREPIALASLPEVFEGTDPLHPRHCKSSYVWRIQRSLQEIHDGETYQVCLTNSVEVDSEIEVLATYLRLREVSPVPYGALLQFPGVSVLSASPERFLTIDSHRVVESKPIKGTRPRGLTEAEDEHLKQELMHSEKDRAENLMIVDLVRNDLNTVCDVGSVHVPDMMYVESYSSVHQLISTVRGTLRDEMNAIDCVRAAFPGGSMTGAPKIRAMELIDELENGPRGVYSGALGWFSLCGAADLSIVIRTLVVTDSAVTFGVGGAIVALSDPQREYEETLVKSRAILTALAGGNNSDRPR